MQAVVLAAGDGGRLLPHTADTPKPLLSLAGRPLINYVLDALHEAGIDDAVIVTGHQGDQVERALGNLRPCGMRVQFARNDEPLLGNARSIWSARDAVTGPFVLAMADHLIEPDLIRALIEAPGDRCRLAIERASAGDRRSDEATRARVRGGRIVALGKQIDDWNALDTGIFWCTPSIFGEVTPDRRDGEAGAVFASLAASGELDAVDVTGMAWLDIDTAQDLAEARARLGEFTAWRHDGIVVA